MLENQLGDETGHRRHRPPEVQNRIGHDLQTSRVEQRHRIEVMTPCLGEAGGVSGVEGIPRHRRVCRQGTFRFSRGPGGVEDMGRLVHRDVVGGAQRRGRRDRGLVVSRARRAAPGNALWDTGLFSDRGCHLCPLSVVDEDARLGIEADIHQLVDVQPPVQRYEQGAEPHTGELDLEHTRIVLADQGHPIPASGTESVQSAG